MSKGKPLGHCRTCGSQIVATINDSLFREGECNACEYHSYRTQPELLEYCEMLLSDAEQMADDPDVGHGWDWSLTVASLRDVIARAKGQAQ